MTLDRLPFEIIETFPSTDADLIDEWDQRVATAATPAGLVRARIGRALASYWATQEAVTDQSWYDVATERRSDLDAAVESARGIGDANLLAEALLGMLYGTWGPDTHLERSAVISELVLLRPHILDEEVRLRSIEWEVTEHLDAADLDAARHTIDLFVDAAVDTELVLFRRREVLWRGCLAMLDGHIDESLAINQEAISSTANVAGSPFSFQNVAITLAIERYLRRGLGDVVEAIRSIRASSPRVGANWDTGLAFALAEIGEVDEATELFTSLTANRFKRVPRDLNWLVTMYLLGLIALTIDAEPEGKALIDALRPFSHLDATHGTGYASYGPVGRVVGSLMARWGDPDEAETVFEHVLSTRAAGPWTALTWLDRATARRHRDGELALADARRAAEELAGFGLDGWQQRSEALAAELLLAGHGGPAALLHARPGSASTWTLSHESGSATVPGSVGLDHLLWLLARPGTPVDLVELDPLINDSLPPVATTETSIDEEARLLYRRRLADLETREQPSAADSAEAEFLRRELAGASHAVSTSAELERLRVRVTKAIRRAIATVTEESPALGTHLSESIETGRTCLYRPADGLAWTVIRR